MTQGAKRSVALLAEVARAIGKAAVRDGTAFSAWPAETARQRLRLDAGRRSLTDWDREHGPLTPEELDDGRARARSLIGRGSPAETPTQRSA